MLVSATSMIEDIEEDIYEVMGYVYNRLRNVLTGDFEQKLFPPSRYQMTWYQYSKLYASFKQNIGFYKTFLSPQELGSAFTGFRILQ